MDSYPTCDCAGCVAERWAAALSTIMPMTATLTNGKDWVGSADYHRRLYPFVAENESLQDEEV